jgi:hypothetical protein
MARTMKDFFASAVTRGTRIEVWLDHPHNDYVQQTGVCIEANEDYLVMGPPDGPGRVCIPYHSLRWFRELPTD